MSKILLIGHGKIGRRYSAILKHLKQDFEIFDPLLEYEPDIKAFDKWIIASPTETHIQWCLSAIELGKTFLCEKPLSKKLNECEVIMNSCAKTGVKGFVVCNYKYLLTERIFWRYTEKPSLKYDYYITGSDGKEWDCCQLIYIDPRVELRTRSPVWKFHIDRLRVKYELLERSYIKMIEDFIEGKYEKLWTVEDGYKMTEATLKRIQLWDDAYGPNRDSGQISK